MNNISGGYVDDDRLFVHGFNGAVWIYEGKNAEELKLWYLLRYVGKCQEV